MTRAPGAESGFTLLEIVVVITLISIIASFAMISLNTATNGDQRLNAVAQRLNAAVELAAEEALLTGSPVGIDLALNGFSFEILRQGEWREHNRHNIFSPYEFVTDVRLLANSENIAVGGYRPDLVLLPDGERLLQTISLADQQTAQQIKLLPYNGSYIVQEELP